MFALRCFVLSVLVATLFVGPALAEKRVALVIGNSAYIQAGTLANPANDAADVAGKLKSLGFTVIDGLNLDKRGFDAKVREFSSALEQADTALLFYAGHGLQIAGRNYLIPTDARLERERDVEFEAVSLDFVLKQMELDRDAKTSIVFLDACRNNPLARNLARSMGTRSVNIGSGLAETFAGVGTFISYSTQPGNVALDGEGRNSPFANALLKRMQEPGKSLTSLMIDVRKDVVGVTGGKQVPWDHSALTGEFYFDPASKAEDTSQLRSKVHQLEDEVRLRTQSATVASNAALVQLRQRVAQMSEETRHDWEKVFELQRQKMDERDSLKLGATFKEIGRLQIGIVKRNKDQQELKTEIARLEKELGGNAAGSATAREVTPAAETKAEPASPPASDTADAKAETPAAETSKPSLVAPIAPSVPGASAGKTVDTATSKPAASKADAARVKATKTAQRRKPRVTAATDGGIKYFGQ